MDIDLKRGVIRYSDSPSQIFKVDPLRLLRAVPLAMKYDFEIHDFMRRSLRELSHAQKISAEPATRRVEQDVGYNPSKSRIRKLKIFGLLPFRIAEVGTLVGSKGITAFGRCIQATLSVLDAKPTEFRGVWQHCSMTLAKRPPGPKTAVR
jgi:hypothetical protein